MIGAEPAFTERGGAEAGGVHAGWPLATLAVSSRSLSLSARFVGEYQLQASEVVELKPCGWLPVLGRGVRVFHTRADYPAKLVFFCLGSPERLIERIRGVGFLPAAPSGLIPERTGIAVRALAIAAAVVVWNVLLLLDGFVPWKERTEPGPFVLLALGLTFMGASAVKWSERVQAIVLKRGRSVSEIVPLLSLLQLVSGFMFLVSTVMFLGRHAG